MVTALPKKKTKTKVDWVARVDALSNDLDMVDRKIDRKFAGAKQSNTLGYVPPVHQSINHEIDQSWQVLNARQSQLIRDMAVIAGAVNAMCSFIVADGIRPQWRVKKADGSIDVETSQMIERKFHNWASSTDADFSGNMTYWEIQNLNVRQLYECGEFIVQEIQEEGGYKLLCHEPMHLQDYNPLISYNAKTPDQFTWRGIDYDLRTKKRLRYNFVSSDVDLEYKEYTVNAEDMIHFFHKKSPSQLRGISDFASVIIISHMLGEYLQSEVTAQNLSSRWVGFVTEPPIGVSNMARTSEYNDIAKRYNTAMDFAQLGYLRSGETVQLNTQQRHSDSFKNFNEIITRHICSAISAPYELVSQDYSGLNFTTLRGGRNDFKQTLRSKWQCMINHFCRRTANNWLKNEVLSGRIDLPDYMKDPDKYQEISWITPVMQQVDPKKEFEADLLKIMAGVKSPQKVIKESGEDPEETIDEIDAWKKMTEARGLIFPALTSGTMINTKNFEVYEAPTPESEEGDDDDVADGGK